MLLNLLNGDCLEIMQTIASGSIDMLFCDLPYAQTRCEWDKLIDLNLFWKEVNRITKLTTPCIFTCTTKFGVSLINSNPKNFRYDMVWVKNTSVGFLNARKMPLRKHELVYIFYRKLPLYDLSSHIHNFLEVGEAPIYDGTLATDGVYGDVKSCKKKGKTSNRYTPPLPNSILNIESDRGHHSTQKPVALMAWFIKYFTEEGNTVLDPTCGSGSTGIACIDLNRNFIGIEKDTDIFNKAKQRLDSHHDKLK